MKQGPPVCGNVTSFGKALGFAAGDVRAGDGSREWTERVVADVRGGGLLEVGAYCTTGNEQAQHRRQKVPRRGGIELVHGLHGSSPAAKEISQLLIIRRASAVRSHNASALICQHR